MGKTNTCHFCIHRLGACLPSNAVIMDTRICNIKDSWVAQLVKRPTSAQVMISWTVGFEPHVRLCADSSEPGACFGFCVSLSLCPSPVHALSLSVSKVNKC